VEHVRSSLRAGSSLVGAFEQLARAGGGWSSKAQQVLDDRDPGEVFQAALDRWAHRDPEPAVATLVDALAVAGATGASQAAALDVASDVIEERRTIRSEVRAATGSQRSSALVLVAVPIGFAVVLAVVDGRVRQLYVGDPVGWACLALGTAFDAAGALWLRQLVRSVR
jgi:tight adherence protein B